MDTLKTFLDRCPPGTTAYLTPAGLGLSLERFDAAAQQWENDGGGDWFRVLSVHRESGSGLGLIDLVKVEVLAPQHLFLGGFVGGQRQTVPGEPDVFHVADITSGRRFTYNRHEVDTGSGTEVVYVWDGLPSTDIQGAFDALR